jgi:hypothetical protein
VLSLHLHKDSTLVFVIEIPVCRAVANILVGATFGRPRAAIRRPYNVF